MKIAFYMVPMDIRPGESGFLGIFDVPYPLGAGTYVDLLASSFRVAMFTVYVTGPCEVPEGTFDAVCMLERLGSRGLSSTT